MAFDKTKPAQAEKIRDLGTVIRPNWEAIQEGQDSFRPQRINFIDRTADGITPEDPVGIANTLIMYCKEDVAGVAQIYVINESSVISQLTGNGTVKAWANFDGTGAIGAKTINGSFNIASITETSFGRYTVLFTDNLSSEYYSVNVTPRMASSFTVGAIAGIDDLTISGFNLYLRSLTESTGSQVNPVCFTVIGS